MDISTGILGENYFRVESFLKATFEIQLCVYGASLKKSSRLLLMELNDMLTLKAPRKMHLKNDVC